MLGKLAYRNAKRSIKDYLIYLITITLSFSLILAFNLVASSDEVAALSSGMSTFKNVLIFVNIVIVFVVCFLINYTTKFMFEKRSKEFGTYMLLGIKKTSIARLLVTENILVGIFAFILAIPIGFVFSQFISVIIVKLLKIPKTIFIFVNFVSIGMLAVYFLLIYLLVLLNLLRRIRKMTVHDFLYFEKQNETKMFHGNRKRNILFLLSIILGIAALALWASRWTLEKKRSTGNAHLFNYQYVDTDRKYVRHLCHMRRHVIVLFIEKQKNKIQKRLPFYSQNVCVKGADNEFYVRNSFYADPAFFIMFKLFKHMQRSLS